MKDQPVNWQVRSETLRQVKELCALLEVTEAELAVMALVALRADPLVRRTRVEKVVRTLRAYDL